MASMPHIRLEAALIALLDAAAGWFMLPKVVKAGDPCLLPVPWKAVEG